ncbi:MAG TPA: hypothetical protein VMT79_16505 [Candidatus Binatia bacterium]|nr:hypothetical protein [Candidatus Binatia bacterium]
MTIGRGLLRTTLRLFAIALPLAFAWEMLQAPAFTGMPESWLAATIECGRAAFGDGVIALGLLAAGAMIFGTVRWFRPPRLGRYGVIIGVGIVIQVAVEWLMVHGLGRWGYRTSHPIVPGLDVGILPVLQAVVLFPLVFWLLARWEAGASVEVSHEA